MCVRTRPYVCTYVKIPTDVEIVDFITIHTKLSGCHNTHTLGFTISTGNCTGEF